MTVLQITVLALLFVGVFGAVLLVAWLLAPTPIKDRLDALSERPASAGRPGDGAWLRHVVTLSSPLAKLSAEDGDHSAVRLRFVNAGWRAASAPALFFAAKSVLTVGLPLLALLVLERGKEPLDASTLLSWMAGAAAAGYYLPDLLLKRKIAARQRDIFESFPDALDLMTVCVEAGLAMDAALARVAGEIGLKSAVLAEELQLVTLELRAGSAKDKALRNLAMRTGVADVDALVTMLIQAERFGTSVGDSLRIQSELLRTKRRQRAEEQAAKIALKLLFPLIFFIFPCLLVVLLGPAFLQIYRVLLPSMGGAE